MNVSSGISEPCHLRLDHLVNWRGILRDHQNPWNCLVSHENCAAAWAPGDTPSLSVGSEGGPEKVLCCHDSLVEFPGAPRLGGSCIPLLWDVGPQGSQGMNHTPVSFPGGHSKAFPRGVRVLASCLGIIHWSGESRGSAGERLARGMGVKAWVGAQPTSSLWGWFSCS